jgi:hypothetical protein
MEFTLKYRGDIRSGVAIKHALRRSFHEQLGEIWRTHNVLSRIDRDKLPAPVKSADDLHYDLPRPLTPSGDQDLSAFLFRFVLCGTAWVPLVTYPMEAHCHLAVRLGRPTRPGTILFGGGDIDNRIKIILDALRMPQHVQEVASGVAVEPEMFALLADDNLVTRLSITTYQLLSGYRSNDDMDVDIDVTVRAITPMAGTWALLF